MTSEVAATADSNHPPHNSRSFLGHPAGLGYIVFTEAWERFSFYGMQALLVLYMANYLLHPGAVEQVAAFAGFRALLEGVLGPLSTQALATQIFGIYGGLIYLAPIFGGLLGDRVLGQRRAVVLGAVIMSLGHFLMALESAFLFALLALVLGCGLLKGNLAAQVGRLYEKNDQRRDAAYSIYYASINIGAFIAPLICGTLGEIYGWHYGFGVAGLGMLVGTAIYLAGRDRLPPDNLVRRGSGDALKPGEGRVIAGLLMVLAVTALFWTAQFQVWNAYVLWIRDRVDRVLFETTVPVTWFPSLDSLAVLLLAPAIIAFWRWQNRRRREPGDLDKIGIGCGIFALACAWLALADMLSAGGAVAIWWPAVFHFICACGYLYVAPTALSLFSRAAPPSINAMMVGVYYLGLFFGSVFSGFLGRFYEILPAGGFWFLHAAIAGSGAVLVWLLRRPLLRLLEVPGSGRQGQERHDHSQEATV
ncbi:peptide MFS transporter [Microbulbifer halophilus]|uniref:Peptide MFS transporter n=1 Tax=Microbulbifer halophilus TaxID=453963 RepID=A0ABW5EE04_9GAMM|nr:peptide MFS transporter [Microbulbifer halophilus]MCW8126941.1 peptide MFS transporter [Microbulbifer halophilus]